MRLANEQMATEKVLSFILIEQSGMGKLREADTEQAKTTIICALHSTEIHGLILRYL